MSYTALYYHIVFSTKDRVPEIDEQWQDRLYGYMGGITRNARGTLLKAGGVADHVHLLVSSHQTVTVSDLVRDIKANSSRWIHETIGKSSFSWQSGYGAFTVSTSQLDVVTAYIENQAEHHRRRTFKEEFIELLRRHGLDYDERYLWS